MKCKKLAKNLLLFTFKTQKEISMTFCRVEEFYESPLKRLVGQKFDMFTFLDQQMNDKGEIDYFSYWTGFNIPGDSVLKWCELHLQELTPLEHELINNITSKVDVTKPFYIIGAKEKDANTLDHEIAHALYYLNKLYALQMTKAIYNFYKKDRKNYVKIVKALKEMGYNESVIKDEVQAYMSTSTKKELLGKFGISLDNKETNAVRNEFRKVLAKYNTFKK